MKTSYFILVTVAFIVGAVISSSLYTARYPALSQQISLKASDVVSLHWTTSSQTYCVGDCTNNSSSTSTSSSWGGGGGGK